MATIVKNDAIKDLNVSWENYSGQSVEDFIKGQLSMHVGYLYRTPAKIGDFYYIYAFQSLESFEKWQSREDDKLVLFRIQLPNAENDSYSVKLETTSNTNKLVNFGDGIKIQLRYTSIAENPVTGVITDTYNEGSLIILRSANGSAYQEVGRLPIEPVEYNDKDTYREVDITNFLADGDNAIRLRVEDSVNGSISNNINFRSIVNTSLIVENAMDTSKPLTSLAFQFYIQGQVAKTLNVKIKGDNIDKTYSQAIGENTYIEVPYNFVIDDETLSTGVLDVEAWLTVDDTTLESDHIKLQVYYIDDTVDESIVILNNVAKTATNYTTTKFLDFTLYNKRSDVTITIGTAFGKYLEYTFPDCETEKTYSFSNVLEVTSQSTTINAIITVKTSDMTVTHPIVIDNSVDFNPIKGADFHLNPKVRDNNEAEPDTIINDMNKGVVEAEFENFKWQSDGWVIGDDGVKVLRIPAEHKVSINYDVLSDVANDTTIEIDFKSYNIFDDKDIIMTMCNYNELGNPIGFEMKALEGCFMTNDNQVRRDQDVMICEGNRTHMAINIVHNLANSNLNYIRIFINGTINREMMFSNSDLFKVDALPTKIILGGKKTDLDIYNIRVYKKALSSSNIRQNYMSSLATNKEKIDYKTANDILSANETISYDKAVVKYNTLVWTGKVPSYKTGNVKYKGNLEINIIGDKKHSGKINNLKIKGQGSSSRGYWKWNHQYDFQSDSVWVDGEGVNQGKHYQLEDDDVFVSVLCSKLNWASSMQSHKMGSCRLFNDLWHKVVGGNSITKTQGYENYRSAINEKPFLYFVREDENTVPTFYAMVTFGSAKSGAEAYVDTDRFEDFILLEGSDNGMPLVLRQIPWIEDEVTYNVEEEYFEYAGAGNLDFDGGKIENYIYFRDAYIFTYQHSMAIVPYDGDLTALNADKNADRGKHYWNKANGDMYRYDWISNTWVDGGLVRETDYLYHYTTQDDVDNGTASEVGKLVVEQYPTYSKFNLYEQTGVSKTENAATDNAAFISWRKNDFKAKIGDYYNVNDTLFNMAFVKLIAASDNWCKNTYEYLDPRTKKICWLNDDLDTIFLSDNVGRKTKPYYVEEHDMNGSQAYFNGSDNVFFNLMENVFATEYRAMMRSILNTMASAEFGGSVAECMERYYFSTQRYFPSVAYNECARLHYEEASVAQAAGEYKNGTPAITQSLGDALQCELGWWKRREVYMQSWAAAAPFAVRSTGSLGFRSMLKTDSTRPSYQFALTPYQWLYPKVGIGQTLGTDNQRVTAYDTYNTISMTTDGNTDTFIYGADYYTNFGEFGAHSIGEAFELSGKRLLEFSADSRKVASYQFRPTSMTVSCPVLRKLCVYGAKTLKGVLDLSSTTKLESVDLRQTALSSVVLPQTDVLKNVYLPDLSSVNIVKTPNLETVYVEGTSNLTSLRTDNDIVLNTYIMSGDISKITELHLESVKLDLSEVDAQISENMYNLLILPDSTASGRIKLNKKLTLEEQQTLINKYGNIDNVNNGLFVEYILETQDEIHIVGDNYITQTKRKRYSVAYGGNDIRGYRWTVDNADFTLINEHEIEMTANNEGNVTIKCVVKRLNNTDIEDTLVVNVEPYRCVQTISLGEAVNIYMPGEYEIPVSYTPTNMNVEIIDIIPTISGINANCTIVSASMEKVVIRTTEPTNPINGTLSLYVEDVDGNNASASVGIKIWKEVKINVVGVSENTIQYGEVRGGDNDKGSIDTLQMADNAFKMNVSIDAEGYSIGNVTTNNNNINVVGVENGVISFTRTQNTTYTYNVNINIPIVNDETGNIIVYKMNNVHIKRNMYITSVNIDNVSWKNGDNSTIKVNYTFSPASHNVDIHNVEYSLSDSIKDYFTYSSESHNSEGGYVMYTVVKNVSDLRIQGGITVKVTDVNDHSKSSTNTVDLWGALAIDVTLNGESQKVMTNFLEGGNSAAKYGLFTFVNDTFTATVSQYSGYSLNGFTPNNSNISVDSINGNVVTVRYNGAVDKAYETSFTIAMRNDVTGDIFNFDINNLSIKKNIYISSVVNGGDKSWFEGNTITFTYTTEPSNCNVAEVSRVVEISGDVANYLTLKSTVKGEIVYNVTKPSVDKVDGTYKIIVTDEYENTYESAVANITMWGATGVFVQFVGENTVTCRNLIEGNNDFIGNTLYTNKDISLKMIFGGYDAEYYSLSEITVTSGTDVIRLGTDSISDGAKDFTYLKDGAFSIRFTITNQMTGYYQYITINNIAIHNNVYIDSIEMDDNIVMRHYLSDGFPEINFSFMPSNNNVEISSVEYILSDNLSTYLSRRNSSYTNTGGFVSFRAKTTPQHEKVSGTLTVKVTDVKNNVKTVTRNANFYAMYFGKENITFSSRNSVVVRDVEYGNVNVFDFGTSNILKLNNRQFVVSTDRAETSVIKLDHVEFANSENNALISNQVVNADGNSITVNLSEEYTDVTDTLRLYYKNTDLDDVLYYEFRNFHAKDYIYITSVKVGDENYINHDKTGEIVLPLTYSPSNYNVGVASVNAVIRDERANANYGYELVEITSQTKDSIKVNVHTAPSDTYKYVWVDVTIVDEEGNVKKGTCHITLYNSVEYITVTDCDGKITNFDALQTWNINTNIVPGVDKIYTVNVYPQNTTGGIYYNGSNYSFTDETSSMKFTMSKQGDTGQPVKKLTFKLSVPNTIEKNRLQNVNFATPSDFRIYDTYCLFSSSQGTQLSPNINVNADIIKGGSVTMTIKNVDHLYKNPYNNDMFDDWGDTISGAGQAWWYNGCIQHIYAENYPENYPENYNDIFVDVIDTDVDLTENRFNFLVSPARGFGYITTNPYDFNEDGHIYCLAGNSTVNESSSFETATIQFTARNDAIDFINYIEFGKKSFDVENEKDTKTNTLYYDNTNLCYTDVIFNNLVINKPIVWRHKIFGKMTFKNCQINCSTPIIFDIKNTYSVNSIPNNIEIDYLDCSWDITTTTNEPINKPMFVNENGEADFTGINPVHIYYGSLNVSDAAYNAVKDTQNIQILPNGSSVEFKEGSSSNCEAYLKKIYGDIVEVYSENKHTPFYIQFDDVAYPKFHILNSNSITALKQNGYVFKINDGEWFEIVDNTTYKLLKGDRLYIKSTGIINANNNTMLEIIDGLYPNYNGNASIYGGISIGGNPSYLKRFTTFLIHGGFDLKLKSAENLYIDNNNVSMIKFSTHRYFEIPPDMSRVTKIPSDCSSMFSNTKLTYPPNLSNVEIIEERGCAYMFHGCSNLIYAPEMPKVKTIRKLGCENMFKGCTSLKNTPSFINSTDSLTIYVGAFHNMFNGCTSLENINLNLDNIVFAKDSNRISIENYLDYNGSINSNGTSNNAKYPNFMQMFRGCTSLTDLSNLKIKIKLSNTGASNPYDYIFKGMFYGCENMTKPPVFEIETDKDNVYYREGIFSFCFTDCKKLLYSPILDVYSNYVYSSANRHFSNAFYGCTSIENVYIKTKIFGDYILDNFLTNANTTGTIYNLGTSIPSSENSNIPEGWTVVNTLN